MALYLDTSALISLFLEEARTQAVTEIVGASSDPIIVSDLADGEFGAAISAMVRTRRLSVEEADAVFGDFGTWAIRATQRVHVTSAHMRSGSAYVRRFDLGLMFPDALHVALCAHLGTTLVTGDQRQAEAADALGVTVIGV